MKNAYALLTATAVGAVGIALAQWRHQQRLDLDSVALHQQLCSDYATNPALAELWQIGDVPADEFARAVAANRQISFTGAKFRLRLLDKAQLRVQAESLMKREGVRAYWQNYRDFRYREATNRRDRYFLSVLDDAYSAAVTALAVAPKA